MLDYCCAVPYLSSVTYHTEATVITNTNQDWSVGSVVRVGFLSLRVVASEATPGDYRPDRYILESAKGVRYSFTPHFGLERL